MSPRPVVTTRTCAQLVVQLVHDRALERLRTNGMAGIRRPRAHLATWWCALDARSARSPLKGWPACPILGRFFAGEKLSTDDVVLLNSYVSYLLDCFGDGSDDESEMRDRMTPEGYADITEEFRKDSRTCLNV